MGRIVAKKQGFKFIDTDLKIEEKCSMKISDIFKKKGEAFFRQEEEKVVLESIEEINSIIALGGVAFLKKKFPKIDVIHDDFLTVTNEKIQFGNYSIIGNFPYNVSCQILFKV